MGLDIDILIIGLFLVLTVSAGLGHGKKVDGLAGYGLGGRNFSTAALVATIVATWVSGSSFFITLAYTYTNGLFDVIASLGMAVSLFLTATVLVPRMGEFLGHLSVAQSMGGLYGKHVRLITALAGILASFGFVAVQFKAFGNIFAYFFDLSTSIAVVTAGVIVTIYSAFGGVRAVTYTDIIQMFTFGFALPLIGLMIWHQSYYIESFSINAALKVKQFDYHHVLDFSNPDFWTMIPLLLYFTVPSLRPEVFQRILMGRNIAQVRQAFLAASVLFAVIQLSMSWIPFLIFNVNPELHTSQLLGYIVNNYTFIGLKGLLLVGVIAMAMSTADSVINSSAVLFANDLCKPLGFFKKKELKAAKVFSLILGIGSIFVAMSEADLFSIVLTGNIAYIPVVTAPLLLAIFGFRTSTKSVLIGMAAGLTVAISLKISSLTINGLFIAMIINAIFTLGSHYLLGQEGGWVGIKDRTFLDLQKQEKRQRKRDRTKFINEFTLIEFIKKYAPKSEMSYMGFGIYCIIFTLTTMYTTHAELAKETSRITLSFYQIMMVTGTAIAAYPIWPLSIKKELKETIVKLWWFVAVFYVLILFNFFFVLVSNNSLIQSSLFSISLVIAVTLLRWRLALVTIPVGAYIALEFYKYFRGVEVIDLTLGGPGGIVIYVALIISAALMMFLRPQQEKEELISAKNQHLSERIKEQDEELARAIDLKHEFMRNLQHEARTPVTGITSMGQILWENYDKLNDTQRKLAAKTVAESSTRLLSFVNNLIDLSELSSLNLTLKPVLVNFSELVEERINICKKFYIEEGNQEAQNFELHIEDKIMIYCDTYYLGTAIDNLIINALQYCKKGKIIIIVNHDYENINFTIVDEGIGIPTDELDDIFSSFTVSSKTHTPAGGRGIGLSLCKMAIEVHGGNIWAESNGQKGATFQFTLPFKNNLV